MNSPSLIRVGPYLAFCCFVTLFWLFDGAPPNSGGVARGDQIPTFDGKTGSNAIALPLEAPNYPEKSDQNGFPDDQL